METEVAAVENTGSEVQESAVETAPVETVAQDEGVVLAGLIEREKEPGVQFTDAELDIMEKYHRGELKPGEKGVDKQGEEKPVEGQKTEAQILEEIFKEVGAKNISELPEKIKGLRSALSGKDAQANARLSDENGRFKRLVANETALFEDARKGVPQALAHIEKTYGLKLVPATAASQAQSADETLDDETADALTEGKWSKLVGVNKTLQAELKSLRELVEGTQKSVKDAETGREVKRQVIDEFHKVAQSVDGLKGTENLRNRIIDWYENGKDDPGMGSLMEVLTYANESAKVGFPISLEQAHRLMQAEKLPELLEEATAKGRNEAYKHKPSPTLSGLQGNENKNTKHTPEQVEQWGYDPASIPAEFFDAKDNLDKTKIPKEYWKAFDLA